MLNQTEHSTKFFEVEYPVTLLKLIEGQAHTYRFNTMPMLKPVSDAVHIGRCIQIMVLVLNDNKSTLSVEARLALMEMIAFHDIAESLVGDVIHDVKQAVPAVDAFEFSILTTLFSKNLTRLSCLGQAMPNATLLRSVDIAEFVMTCTTELELGNKRIIPWLRSGVQYLSDIIMEMGRSLMYEQNSLHAGQQVTLVAIKNKALEELRCQSSR